MKYRNLFFDLDDTIWAFSRNARDTFEEVYRKYSFERYFDSFDHYYTIYQQRNTELWIEYGEGKITKDELNRQRFSYPLQAVGVEDEFALHCVGDVAVEVDRNPVAFVHVKARSDARVSVAEFYGIVGIRFQVVEVPFVVERHQAEYSASDFKRQCVGAERTPFGSVRQ